MTFLFCFLSVRLEQVCASEARTRLLLRDRWGIKHWKAPGCTVCDLPCSCDNSPASSGNLDQSVESMNPHLPGVQDKISRPSQVGRDWRHEITFSVFDSTIVLSAANTAEKKVEDGKRENEEERGSSTLATLLPSHPFAAELRQQLWWCAVLSHSCRVGPFRDTHVFDKTIPPRCKTKQWSTKHPTSIRCCCCLFVWGFNWFINWQQSCRTRAHSPLVPPLLSGLHTGFVVEAHIPALVPVQKCLDFPLPCDLCR